MLDALFIKMWGMGIFGAALASGISYLLGALILLLRYLSKTAQIRFIKPFGSRRVILRASYNGLSEFINEISGGLVVFTINWVLMIEVGIVGVAAFTVASYLLWFSVMIGYGIAEALGPLVSVNFGAKKPERISKFVNLGVVTSIFIGLLLSTALLLYPQELINIFLENGEVNTIEMTMGIIAVTWPIFLFNGINITISGYFTGMQAAKQSAMIALSRSLVLPIALILLFWNMFGLKGVFWALPTVEILTFALTAMLYSRLKPNALIGQDDKSSELIEEPA